MKKPGKLIIALLISVISITLSQPAEAGEKAAPVKNRADLTKNSYGVKVAILDSGSNLSYKEGISLVDGTVRDYNGHGTLMAGIVKEIKPDAEMYVIKVVGKDGLAVNEEAVIRGLEWAISRDVDVINMSLRLKGSAGLHHAIQKAYSKGIVLIAAAGNTISKMSVLNSGGAMRSAPYDVAYPARYNEVIAVGALDRYGRVYVTSIQGEEVDFHITGYKGNKAGTSVASAYAAGYAAKIISDKPDSNADTIKEEIKNIIGQRANLPVL